MRTWGSRNHFSLNLNLGPFSSANVMLASPVRGQEVADPDVSLFAPIS